MRQREIRRVQRVCQLLRSMMEQENGADLAGYCAEASCRLAWILQELHFRPVVLNGHVKLAHETWMGHHWWVRLGRHYLDITGDQFNQDLPKKDSLPAVMIAPVDQCPRYVSAEELDPNSLRKTFPGMGKQR